MVFPGAPFKMNGAPGNIQGNLERYASAFIKPQAQYFVNISFLYERIMR